jgi:hypothetical protein
MRFISQALKVSKYFAFGYIKFMKISNKRGEETSCGHTIENLTMGSLKCSLYLWMNTPDAQKITKKK